MKQKVTYTNERAGLAIFTTKGFRAGEGSLIILNESIEGSDDGVAYNIETDKFVILQKAKTPINTGN